MGAETNFRVVSLCRQQLLLSLLAMIVDGSAICEGIVVFAGWSEISIAKEEVCQFVGVSVRADAPREDVVRPHRYA